MPDLLQDLQKAGIKSNIETPTAPSGSRNLLRDLQEAGFTPDIITSEEIAPQPTVPKISVIEQPPLSPAMQFLETVTKIPKTFGEKVIPTGAELVLGRAQKTVGGLAKGAIESAKELITGKPITEREGLDVLGRGQKITTGDAAFTFIELYPGGELITNSLKALPKYGGKIAVSFANKLKVIPEFLRTKAIEQYSQALRPTKELLKKKTAQVVPELIERGVKGTQAKLAEIAKSAKGVAGKMLERGLEAVPEGTKVLVKPVLDTLEKYKQSKTVAGVVAEPQAIEAANSLQEIIKGIAKGADEIDYKNFRKLRQIWDNTIAKSKRLFSEEAATFRMEAKRQATNAIRSELAKASPEMAVLNKEYSFWKNVDNIITSTIQRTKPQATPMGEQIVRGAAVAGGLARGGARKAIVYGEVARQLRKLFTSTVWRTANAVLKDRIANLLTEGNFVALSSLVGRILSATREKGE